MNRKAPILAWAVAGAVLTGALTAAAVAVAGNDIATPVRPFGLTSNRGEQPVQGTSEPHEGQGHTSASGESGQRGDDQGGGSTSGSNSGPDLESSGAGSGDSGESEEISGSSGDDQDGGGGGSDD